MKLKLTNHFQDRFGQRNINFDHVKQAIKNPDLKEIVFEGRIKVTKNLGDSMVEVLYYKDGFKDRQDEYILITVYYK